MSTSRIEWTEQTWNPTVGCTKVSPGCAFCYAEVMARRLQAMGIPQYKHGFKLQTLPERLSEPLERKKPTTYFVNSMSDLFHKDVPYSYIDEVLQVIEKTPQHTYQILTKRAGNMARYFKNRTVPLNAWLGVSVENKKHGLPRIDELRKINARVRFLSIEPLLEELGEINLEGISWVIVGGESGTQARPMQRIWASSIQKQCKHSKVPFFFKQWGTWGPDGIKRSKGKNGRLLNGRTWDEMPKIPIINI